MTLFNIHDLTGTPVRGGVLGGPPRDEHASGGTTPSGALLAESVRSRATLVRSSAPFRGGDNRTPLEEAGVRGIVDLRDPDESAISEQWDRERFDVREVPVFAGDLCQLEWRTLPDLYRIMARDYAGELARAVETVAELSEEGGVLIHCTAGKDRTGLVTALVLDLLGTGRGDIEADYLSSSDKLGPAYLAALHGGREIPGEAAHLSTAVPLPALREAGRIVAGSGGTREYLERAGMDAAIPGILRAHFVVPE